MLNINPIKKEDVFEDKLNSNNQDLSEIKKTFKEFLDENSKNKTEIKVLEFSNFIDSLEKEKLNGPNGYYSKKSFSAIDEENMCAKKVFDEMIDLINQRQRELKLKEGYGLKLSEIIKTKKLNTILKGIITHEINETLNWKLEIIEEAKINAINKGVSYRNNKDDLNLALQNGQTVILYKGKLLNSNENEVKSELLKFVSDFHSNIIMAYVRENDILAKKYFYENKKYLLPKNLEKLEEIVNELDKNCKVEIISNELFNLYSNDEKELNKNLDKVKEFKNEVKDKVLTMLKFKKQEDDKIQDKILNEFFSVVQNKVKNEEPLDFKDIQLGLNLENQENAKKYIEKINKKGFIETDENKFLNLFEKFNRPQEFKKLNLQKFRFFLSDEDFEILKWAKDESSKSLEDIYELIQNALKNKAKGGKTSDIIIKTLNDIKVSKEEKARRLSFEEIKKIIDIRLKDK